jgi:hypothetical protein
LTEQALFRGGPRDGEALRSDKLPCEVRFAHRTKTSDCDWEHVYTLRGVPSEMYYEHIGHRLVGPPNETYSCPACAHPFRLERELRKAGE